MPPRRLLAASRVRRPVQLHATTHSTPGSPSLRLAPSLLTHVQHSLGSGHLAFALFRRKPAFDPPLPQGSAPVYGDRRPRPLWRNPCGPLGAVGLRVQRRCLLVPEPTRLRLCRCSPLRNTLPCGVRRSPQVINNQSSTAHGPPRPSIFGQPGATNGFYIFKELGVGERRRNKNNIS